MLVRIWRQWNSHDCLLVEMQKDATTFENSLVNHILAIRPSNSTPKNLLKSENVFTKSTKRLKEALTRNSPKLEIPQIATDK